MDPRFMPPVHTRHLYCDQCADVFWVARASDPDGLLCFVCGTAGTVVAAQGLTSRAVADRSR